MAQKFDVKKFNRALAVNQTGAKFIGIKNGKKNFRLGGAIFTENELVRGRVREARSKGSRLTSIQLRRKGLL